MLQLRDTKDTVLELRETLEKLKPVLAAKSKEVEALLQQVASDQAVADKVKAVIEVEEQLVAKQTAEVQEIQQGAQADLDLAMPAYVEASKVISHTPRLSSLQF